ncbi:hypothetical protein LCL95_00355 [Bacillus timonensis]|nr:hypothetical protein [Bacillus timonensis]
MEMVKNCLIVFVFGFLIVGMIFVGVSLAEAKGKNDSKMNKVLSFEVERNIHI